MTARFGRNKRRAAREAVAQAEARAKHSEEYWRGLYDQEAKLRHESQQFLAEIVERLIRAVGPQSALIPRQLQPSVHLPYFQAGTRIRWPIRNTAPDVDGFPTLDHDMGGYALIREEHFVHVLQLVLIVERDPASFRTLVSFAFEPKEDASGMHRRAYMISRDALARIGWRWHDVRYYVEDIVHRLLTMQERTDGR